MWGGGPGLGVALGHMHGRGPWSFPSHPSHGTISPPTSFPTLCASWSARKRMEGGFGVGHGARALPPPSAPPWALWQEQFSLSQKQVCREGSAASRVGWPGEPSGTGAARRCSQLKRKSVNCTGGSEWLALCVDVSAGPGLAGFTN